MAKFAKGQSGNPGGRPKDEYGLKELAKAKTKEAIETIIEIMRDKEAPHAARLNAACALLDRGHGKPVQMTEVTGKDGGAIETKVDDTDLARRIAFLLTKASKET